LCQRTSVRGLTEKADQACRGSARLNAVRKSRSASRICGRLVWRRKIESSCRSTRISNSFDPGDRQASTTSSNRRRTTKYVSDHSTRNLQRTGVADATEPPPQDRPDAGDRVFEPHGIVDAICELLARGGERAGIKSSFELADPAEALRSVLSSAVRFWAAEEDLHRSLYGLAEIDPAARAFVDRQTSGRRTDLRRLSERLHDAGQLRPVQDDALALLLVATSFATYDELRRNAKLTPGAVEQAVARVATILLNDT
jgi:hypothetical protein